MPQARIYNVFDQSPEDELFPARREHDVGVLARVPLDEGGLTGKVGPDTEFSGDDVAASEAGALPTDWREKLRAHRWVRNFYD
jgi:aryl-alcohol dehydrogenase-like predicted oxidoreductase